MLESLAVHKKTQFSISMQQSFWIQVCICGDNSVVFSELYDLSQAIQQQICP